MPKLTQNQRMLFDAVAAAPLQTVSIDDLDGKPGALMTSARALARRGLITIVDGEGDAGPILSLTEDGRVLCAHETPEAKDGPGKPAQKLPGATKQHSPGTPQPRNGNIVDQDRRRHMCSTSAEIRRGDRPLH